MAKVMTAWVSEHEDELAEGDPIIAQAAVVQLIRLQQFATGYMVPLLDDEGNQVVHFIHKDHVDPITGKKPGKKVPINFPGTCTPLCREAPQWRMTDPSAKLDALLELMLNRDQQMVVWSSSKTAINLLAKRLDDKGWSYGILTGDTPQLMRDQYVRDFQAGKLKYFIGTIKAGGVGITLHASSTTVFIDRMWNPSTNTQAEDREHRIGQKNAVEIIDIVARGTVDLEKARKLVLKGKWLKMLLGDEVDDEELAREIDVTGRFIDIEEDE
jgi:SNF2 family DNA or RNA helicase